MLFHSSGSAPVGTVQNHKWSSASYMVMMASNVPAQSDQLVPSNCVILTPEGMPNPTLYALDMRAEIAGCERGGLPVNVGPVPGDGGREGAVAVAWDIFVCDCAKEWSAQVPAKQHRLGE